MVGRGATGAGVGGVSGGEARGRDPGRRVNGSGTGTPMATGWRTVPGSPGSGWLTGTGWPTATVTGWSTGTATG